MVFKHLNRKLYGDRFCLKKFIRTGNYLLLTGRHIPHYLMERIMALQQMIDRINTFSFILSILSGFILAKFCPRHLCRLSRLGQN